MKRLYIKLIIVLILFIILLPTGAIGCSEGTGDHTIAIDDEPFYPDCVVTVRITMEEGDWEFLKTNALTEQYVKADLFYNGELVPDVAVRPKGNSSLITAVSTGTTRFSLKVDLNFFNAARNLHGVKKLNFNNGFSDPTLIREFLAYEIFEQMGIPTPRASFVDLWVNDTHLGLYTMVEQIDKTFLGDRFDDNSGNLYKPEMPAAYLIWTEEDLKMQRSSEGATGTEDQINELDVNLGGGKLAEIMQALEPNDVESQQDTSLPGFLPPGGFRLPGGIRIPGIPGSQQGDLLDQMGLKTNENKSNHSLLFRFLDILNNEPDETFPAEIEKVLDVDEVLRFLAVSTLIVHLDNYIAMGHNYYLYDDNGKFVIIPWDLNMAFGTFNFGLDRNQLINYYIDEPTGGAVDERPLVNRLLSHQTYLDTYHGYLRELLDGPFAIDRINSRIDQIADLVRPFVAADELKFFSTKAFERSLTEDLQPAGTQGFMPGTLSNTIGLKAFVKERHKSVIEQLDGTRKSRSDDGSGNGGRFGFFGNMPRRN